MVELNVVEARVLGALIEKEINTPEYYPLSLNAAVNACNQKSSREPVMELSEADVRTALFELDQLGLVRTIAESRATKFEHRVRDVLNLRRDEVAVMCLLLLRGAQTSAELRARTERMYAFDDNAAVLTVLERLAGREVSGQAEPLTQLMARQAGAREARWVHLLCGPVDAGLVSGAEARVRESGPGAPDSLVQRVAALEEVVRGLEERLGVLERGVRGDLPGGGDGIE
ncbi:YceH family protein [Granulicella sp. L46]|uniref:YceH family protein n=1 Tax=Granulicella sp. L46 TaxID=1641865 RepID=UPI00131C23A5|nr:YceH family protein [Granulicella sp. L46]